MRGIASLIVVLGHLVQTFRGGFSDDLRTRLAFLPGLLAFPMRAVIQGFISGPSAVWLFWIMSAFVLSLQFFLRVHQLPATRSHDYLEEAFLRRYPRLLIPVLASVLFAYALQACHLMYSAPLGRLLGFKELAVWYAEPASAVRAVKSAAWDTFFAYDPATSYNGVLWTMEKEFYGSLFLFAFLGVLGHRSSRFVVYPLITLVDFFFRLYWLTAFVFGIALCDLFVNRTKFIGSPRVPRPPFIRSARHHAGSGVLVWVFILMICGLPNIHGVSYLLVGTFAVTFTLVSRPTQYVLSSRVPMFLGQISFSLYLIHWPVLCSFSCWLYLHTFRVMDPAAAAWLTAVPTVALCLVLAYFFNRLADQPGIRLSRAFAAWVVRAPGRLRRRVLGSPTDGDVHPSPA